MNHQSIDKETESLDDINSTEINIVAMVHYLLFGTESQFKYAIAEQLLHKMKNTCNIFLLIMTIVPLSPTKVSANLLIY